MFKIVKGNFRESALTHLTRFKRWIDIDETPLRFRIGVQK